MEINKSIFRAYDIRGIYPLEINDEFAYLFGQAMGTYIIQLGKKEILIGFDNRISSIPISNFLIKGILSTGANVINLGLVTTPMFYYGRILLNNWAGIMITASHNPMEYNGFKISFNKKGNALSDEIENFRNFILQKKFLKGNGKERKFNIKNDYIKLIKNSLSFGKRKINVIVDCGNGTSSIIVDEVLKELPINYKLLYANSDGTFPNHHPDPSVRENLKDLQKKVIENKYDIGLMLDADADRIGIVDENGQVLDNDIYMAIMYRYLNFNLKNRTALFDVKCSKALSDELDNLNIKKMISRTGNSYIYRAIHENKIDFGGEYSGHIFFNDKFPGIDDGLYAGLRLIELLSNTDKKIDDLTKNINKYYSTEEIKIEVSDISKFLIVDKVKEYAKSKNYNYIDIDGVRIEWEDSWALIRASNTGPNILLRFESKNKEKLKMIKNEFISLLNQFLDS